MNSPFDSKEKCSGCGACGAACPRDAIVMKPDEEGFLYPSVDSAFCIDCRICLRVCPFQNENRFKEPRSPSFYAAKHKDGNILRESTSGGAFTALSDFILRQGGVVYGAAFDANFRVVHGRAETDEECARFRVSKYVQSRTIEAYSAVVDDLRVGRLVLFTGTPCQTAGLRGLTGSLKAGGKLYTCDVICHSIPSPLIWEEYKKLLERENGGRLTDVRFRSKKQPWTRKNSNKTFEFRTSASLDRKSDERFYALFFGAGIIMRRSCFACPFTDIFRASDITIADYWGIEKYMPEFYDPLGVSLIMTNSAEGEKLIEAARNDLIVRGRPPEESLREQKRLSEPSSLSPLMEDFWKDFHLHGFEYTVKKYIP